MRRPRTTRSPTKATNFWRAKRAGRFTSWLNTLRHCRRFPPRTGAGFDRFLWVKRGSRPTDRGTLLRRGTRAREARHDLVEEPLIAFTATSCAPAEAGIIGGQPRASDRGRTNPIGLNIGLPQEQRPNEYVTPELSFEFHYFFMRKLWFAHLARALVVFPGGFGTLDELTEILTLMQTRKLERGIPVLLYGSTYWNEVIHFDALVRHGMIDAADLQLFQYVDDPPTALALLKERRFPPSQKMERPRSHAPGEPRTSEGRAR